MNRILYVFVMFFVCFGAEAQEINLHVRGYVTDDRSRRPLEGATVNLVGGNAKNPAVTDINGLFILELRAGVMPGDSVRIRIEKHGYATYDANIVATEAVPLHIQLSPTNSSRSKVGATKPGKTERAVEDMVFLDCQPGLMPASIPASGHIYSLALSEAQLGGILDSFGPPGNPQNWNPAGTPERGDRCELTNYSSKVVLNLELTLHVVFKMADKVAGQEHAWKEGSVTSESDRKIDIAKLDPGPERGYVFYLRAYSTDRIIRLSAPDYVIVSGEGNDRKRVQLKQARSNFRLSMGPRQPAGDSAVQDSNPADRLSERATGSESISVEVKRAKPAIELSFSTTGDRTQKVPVSVLPHTVQIEPDPTIVNRMDLPKDVPVKGGVITVLRFGIEGKLAYILFDTSGVAKDTRIRIEIIGYSEVQHSK